MNRKIFIFLGFCLFLNVAYSNCFTIQKNGFVTNAELSGYVITAEELELPAMKNKFSVWLLKLDKPLDICNPTFFNQPKSLDCIQILSSDFSNHSLNQYQSEHIKVKGDIYDGSGLSEVVTPVAIIRKNDEINFLSDKVTTIKNYHCQSTDWSLQNINS